MGACKQFTLMEPHAVIKPPVLSSPHLNTHDATAYLSLRQRPLSL